MATWSGDAYRGEFPVMRKPAPTRSMSFWVLVSWCLKPIFKLLRPPEPAKPMRVCGRRHSDCDLPGKAGHRRIWRQACEIFHFRPSFDIEFGSVFTVISSFGDLENDCLTATWCTGIRERTKGFLTLLNLRLNLADNKVFQLGDLLGCSTVHMRHLRRRSVGLKPF